MVPGGGAVRGTLESALERAWHATAAELRAAGLDAPSVHACLSARDEIEPEAEVRRKASRLVAWKGNVASALHQSASKDLRYLLTGPAADNELRAVVRALRAMPGVRKVECRLRPHHAVPA